MNKRIKRYLEEIEKTESRIAELQQYLKGVQTALKQEENNEMIKSIRGMKLNSHQLFDLLNGIQDGRITFTADGEFHSENADGDSLFNKEQMDGSEEKSSGTSESEELPDGEMEKYD